MKEVDLFGFTQNMTDAVVLEWFVEDGESVEAGQDLVEVESEKAAQVIPASTDGVVSIQVEEGEQVDVGTTLAVLDEGTSKEDVEEEAAETKPSSTDSSGSNSSLQVHDSSSESQSTEPAQAIRASPAARAVAHDHDLDLTTLTGVEGHGPDGALVERDVTEALASKQGDAQPKTPMSTITKERGIYEEQRGSQLRQAVANQMSTSSDEEPQVTLNRTIPVDALLDLKDRLEGDLKWDLSITDFLIAAVSKTLREHPKFNAIYEDETHKLAERVNIGLAVDLEDGLVTPVLHNADRQTVTEISTARQELVEKAKRRDYTAEDLEHGTFTITNLGHYNIDSFDPLLNVPEVAILGLGSIRPWPVTGDTTDAVQFEQHIGVSLTFNHRTVDGTDAAKFLATLSEYLERPMELLSIERSSQGPFMERTIDDTNTKRAARATSAGEMTANVQSRRFEWIADEPEDRGGTDSAPTPVEQFIGSLASCLNLTINMVANRRGVSIESTDVAVESAPEEGAIEQIDIQVHIKSDADREDIEQLVATAERACYVSRIISDDIERTSSISVEKS